MPSEDPLGTAPFAGRLCDPEKTLCRGDWERLVGRVFTEENSPRWIVFLAGSLVLLLDRHTFAQGRYLSFDFDELYGRNQKSAFDHFAAFLSAETLCSDGESDKVIHDTIEEQSHRFAHGVTDNLQAAVREAIVELVNEWVEDRRRRKLSYTRRTDEIAPKGTASNGNGDREISAEDLKHEALVFVYRLLFCFYAEARAGELDILPIGDDIYRLGYSLESLPRPGTDPALPRHRAGPLFSRAPENPVQHHPSGVQPQARLSRKTCGRPPGRSRHKKARAAGHVRPSRVRPRRVPPQDLRHPPPDRHPVRPVGHAAFKQRPALQPLPAKGRAQALPEQGRKEQVHRPGQLRGAGHQPAGGPSTKACSPTRECSPKKT